MTPSKFSAVENPFTPARVGFWGRQFELNSIYQHLQSEPPQSCTIVGEIYSGKTTLLKRVEDPHDSLSSEELSIRRNYTFVYLDCEDYNNSELARKGPYASMVFWWKLYEELYEKLHSEGQEKLAKPDFSFNNAHLENAIKLKSEVEDLIHKCSRIVVIILDNFEGVARLPLRDSQWLRSLGQLSCTFIVASRYLLHLLYQNDLEQQNSFSPFWNLFSDPIYLSLMDEEDVGTFLESAREKAQKLGSIWSRKDIKYIRRMAGRHPELLRIACMRMFETHLANHRESFLGQERLDFNLVRDAQLVCNQLWSGLADPRVSDSLLMLADELQKAQKNQGLSLYQEGLLNVALGKEVAEESTRIILQERGLIEFEGGQWQVFSELMRDFVLNRIKVSASLGDIFVEGDPLLARMQKKLQRGKPIDQISLSDKSFIEDNKKNQQESSKDQGTFPTFTYLESKVYNYLYAHIEQVCTREDIKRFIWQDEVHTDSALQKIIDRMRKKIEDSGISVQVIAVRGKGYMLQANKSTIL